MEELIKLENVWFAYFNSKYVIKNVNLTLNEREAVAILGPNGSGKTTLIKLFVGLLRPSRGHVYVKGVNIKDKRVCEVARNVGIVFQNPNHQLFEYNVKEEILFGPRNFKDEFKEDEIYHWIEKLDLDDLLLKSPLLLSEGEKRRVALASVLAYQPDVLVLDEPTTGQDKAHKEVILNVLLDYVKMKGKAVVITTHDLDFAWRMASRFIVLNDGEIVYDGDPKSAVEKGVLIENGLKNPSAVELGLNLKRMGLEIKDYDVTHYIDVLKKRCFRE